MGISDELTRLMSNTIVSRHWAADTLRAVANAGEHGLFPSDFVSCADFAKACFRVVMNARTNDDESPFDAFIKAFETEKKAWDSRERS